MADTTNTNKPSDQRSGEFKGNQPMGQAERKPEQAGTDQERKDKSAIGGGDKSQSGNQPSGQSSDQDFNRDKAKTETTGQGR